MSATRPLRVDLVVPRTPRFAGRAGLERLWRESPGFRGSSFFAPLPHLGLLTLAGHTPPGVELRYLDENVGPVRPDGRADVAAITAMTCQAPGAYRLAATFRRRGAHVVLGGMHPTAIPGEAAVHADTVVTGEAEAVWPAFLDDFRRGKPRRRYAARGPLPLGGSRPPRYDLVDPRRFQAMPVQVGRGCPLGCEFCSVETVHGRRYRHKNAARVVGELERIRALWPAGKPRVFFTDDNLHLRRRLLGGLLEAIIPLRLNWMAQMDVSVGDDPEVLDLMAASGCSQLLVGFESLDRDSLQDMQPGGVKPRSVDDYARLARNIQSRGIRVLGMFIVGLDRDRADVFRRLRDFILDTGLHDAQVTIQTPLPGTRLRRRLARAGRLLDPPDWAAHDFFHLTYRPRHLTAAQLLRGQTWVYRQVHRPEAAAARRRYWLDLFRERAASR